MNDPQQNPKQNKGARSVSIKSVIAQAVGGLFIVLGALVWWAIFPRTLYSFEGFGVELGIITGYVIVFAVLYLIGTLFFIGSLGKKNPIAITIAVIGVALLIAIITTVAMHGRPA